LENSKAQLQLKATSRTYHLETRPHFFKASRPLEIILIRPHPQAKKTRPQNLLPLAQKIPAASSHLLSLKNPAASFIFWACSLKVGSLGKLYLWADCFVGNTILSKQSQIFQRNSEARSW